MNYAYKPNIKIGFIDCFDSLDAFMIEHLSLLYNVIRNDENPDFLFFCDEEFGIENKKFDSRPEVTKIFVTGENRRPWNYSCHYAITFDHFDTPKHYRLPLYVIHHWMAVKQMGMKRIEDVVRSPSDLSTKTKFCAFIVKNPHCEMRNNAFHSLSTYKTVDSVGPLFNNMGYVLPRGFEAPVHKDNFLKDYKFNLCFENSSWPGYCTEKLFQAFYSKTIPIYWGSPTVEMDFNKKAFVNFHDFNSANEFYRKIVELDRDDEAYLEMYMQPIFTDGKSNKYMNMDRFLLWFNTNVYGKR